VARGLLISSHRHHHHLHAPHTPNTAKFGLKANLAAKGDNKSVPARDTWALSPDAKYVHYCDNETIGGE
jgi:phosphoserine aminotransferase